MKATRKEHDFLGELEIPNEVYYGVQTFRAIENFNITGIPISKEPLFIKALGYVKKAAAMANKDCGVLDAKIAEAICYGSDQLIAGKFDQEFVSDLIQGGAGTSVNMNLRVQFCNLENDYVIKTEWRKTGESTWNDIDSSFYFEPDLSPVLINANKIKNLTYIVVGKSLSEINTPTLGFPETDKFVVRNK